MKKDMTSSSAQPVAAKHPGKVSAWIEAMRLRTLPVSLAGVMAGIALAWYYAGDIKWIPAVLCFVFALLAQIASNFANEYFDFKDGLDKKGREGPRRGVTEGDITPKAMLAATLITLGSASVIGLCMLIYGGVWLLIPGAIIVVGALAYSTGPWPLSRHALGEVAVFVFFGIAPVTLTFYLQIPAVTWPVWACASAIGLMGVNVLLVNNIRDIPDDLAVKKITLANLMGHNRASLLYLVNAVIALPCMAVSVKGSYWGLIAGIFYLAVATPVYVRMRNVHGRCLTRFLGMSSVAMAICSLMLFMAKGL